MAKRKKLEQKNLIGKRTRCSAPKPQLPVSSHKIMLYQSYIYIIVVIRLGLLLFDFKLEEKYGLFEYSYYPDEIYSILGTQCIYTKI